MSNMVMFKFDSYVRWYNMDQMIYAEPGYWLPDWKKSDERKLRITVVFAGEKEDVKLEGENADRLVAYINSRANTPLDKMAVIKVDALPEVTGESEAHEQTK